MPYRETIQKAMALGANLLVTHEPPFYIHRDLRDDHLGGQEVDDKREWLDAQDITIIRCHDVWDAIQDIGIPYALGRVPRIGDIQQVGALLQSL